MKELFEKYKLGKSLIRINSKNGKYWYGFIKNFDDKFIFLSNDRTGQLTIIDVNSIEEIYQVNVNKEEYEDVRTNFNSGK
ncbi:MAG: hypothetical protein AABY32_02790 [Nanoarchaeota archaeon]